MPCVMVMESLQLPILNMLFGEAHLTGGHWFGGAPPEK
jgi:hypothetical protein